MRTGTARSRRLLPVLLLATGCGVTSIYVPVERPAEIFLRRFNAILLHAHAHAPDGRYDFPVKRLAPLIEREAENALSPALGIRVLNASDHADAAARDSDVPAARYTDLTEATGADCLLQWHVLECRYDEGVQSGEVRRTGSESSFKNVRKGTVRLRVLVSATDMNDRQRFWEDTVQAVASAQSKTSQGEPDDVDSLAVLLAAIRDLVDDVTRRATPRREKAVVSFLKDSDYPDVVKGIRAAERGDWKTALTLFGSVARKAAGTDGEHRMLHNLGMAQLYAGDFRSAYDTFHDALALKADKRYEHAIRQTLDMEKESQEWEKQRRR